MFEGNIGTSTLLKEIFTMGWKKKTLGLLWVSCLFFPKTTLQQLLGEPSFRKTLKKLHLPKVQQNLGELLIFGGGHQSIDGDVCTVINIYIYYIYIEILYIYTYILTHYIILGICTYIYIYIIILYIYIFY